MIARAFLILLLFALAPAAAAQVEVVMPLGGYYQPGRYVPVRVRAAAGGAVPGDVTLRAAGAVPTVVPAEALAGGQVVTVPWLAVTGAATELKAFVGGSAEPAATLPLTRVQEGERLVAVTGGDAALAFARRRLFPGARVLPVVVQHPAAGQPVAWESLDAAVLDHLPDAARVTALLAMGVTLAVRESDAPRDGWPWVLDEGYWVLRREVAGPRGAVVPEAYDPPQMWDPGRPAGMRRGAVMGLALFALAGVGLSLLRPKWGAAALVGTGVVATVLAVTWRRCLSPVVEAGGAVIVTSDALTQRDDWIYRRHAEPAAGAIAAPASDVLLKPAFASPRQVERTQVVLRAGVGDEPPTFTYRLEPGWTLAFRATRVAPGRWPGKPAQPARTPMRELGPLYLAAGREISGELPEALPGEAAESAQRWPALVIESELPKLP